LLIPIGQQGDEIFTAPPGNDEHTALFITIELECKRLLLSGMLLNFVRPQK